jgi:cytochrome c-type biogenesis protein CcmH
MTEGWKDGRKEGGLDRRAFLSALGGTLFLAQQADPLRDPARAGQSRAAVGEVDNSEVIKGIERRLKCTCGCNLDIYTCRTTDFTCSYSPALHQEVLALHEAGTPPDEIVAAFVGKYGEQILMAPKPEGFNLAAYLVPGIVVVIAGTVLALVLLRRQRMVRAEGAATVASLPRGDAERAETVAASASEPTAVELERLREALSEVAD